MMIRALVSSVVIAVVAAAAGPALAAPAPVSLRSMTFQFEISSRTEQRVQTSGLTQTDSMSGSPIGAAGGASVVTQQSGSVAAKGTIAVEVVAITADGLVVDITETADGRGAPKTRIGITTKGKLIYDASKAVVNEEEILLLQLLNRSLVEGHDADGVSWTDDVSERGFKDVTTYHVVSSEETTPGPLLHIELERSVSASAGAYPFDLTENGKLDYNEQRAVPLGVTLRERRTGRNAGGQQIRTEATYTYKLAADTGVRH
ncbi:MAG TPA: hypothetical protein VGX96_01715 [Candidatus Elarobacter sp.]|jgi:hypothetical protein|nr:hypothetical protein [Candidatus Elarobacter sp.]